ncbi:interleukin-12 receptor subunit beta-1 [Cyprinodon tularosa]|uniref:interleukin-12 receptor subunit beta-1 n=1 Tax=Cyprinodon tularosa TaxID=77115 RepID=UPI0018E1E7E5|nr:interleukin-12 receptor subunit beta-1 [Cyprinodon tularosa]
METFQHLRALHGCVIFLLIATINKGSTCEPPSMPLCFRQNEGETVYICEWDFSPNGTNVTFDLYFNDTSDIITTPFKNIKENRKEINEEILIVGDKVDIWVEAHAGDSVCTSPIRSGILRHTVKYETPQNISISWLRNNLSLSWQSKYPSLAEVSFRKYEPLSETWEKRILNTTREASTQKLIIVNLLKNASYQVRIRVQSIQAENPLWSNWSPDFLVPAELEHPPEVEKTTPTLLNGTRRVTVTWKPMHPAAAVGGVTYSVHVTQYSPRCPCKKKSHETRAHSHVVYVSYSAVNITVIARNAAGHSPPATIHIPAASSADLKSCNQTLLDEKFKKGTCLEFYELQDADLIPERAWCLTSTHRKKERKKIKTNMMDYTRYLYFEHRCHNGKPQTVQMCFYYKKEGVPSKEPQDFMIASDMQDSADQSWKEIPYEHLHGILTHYKLCTVKMNEPQECVNISASATKHHLKDLTPGTKYNVSLAGVTQAGVGPVAMQSFTTLPEKPFNVWISFGLLFGFFLFTIACTTILKRIKNKVFPPVPKPVIPEFSPCQPENQEIWERKEEVDNLSLHPIDPETSPVSKQATVLEDEWDDGAEQKEEAEEGCSGGSDDERTSLTSADETVRTAELKDMEQVESELAMLIYRNGLVFDVKSESL